MLEIDELAPWHELFRQTHEHSDSGLTGLATEDAAIFLDEVLKSGRPNLDDASQWGAMLRFACEDLRNYYLAAVLVRPGGAASPSQAADWFWGETSAGALILALHPICLASEDPGLRTVAERQLVPRAQRHRLE